jgi:hypothetical protein
MSRLSLVVAAILAGGFMTPAGASERATPVPTQAPLDGVRQYRDRFSRAVVRLQPDQAPPVA